MTWDDSGRRFDLITCGDAWHWIDPEAGTAKAARVLAPGGLMAWFRNSSHMEEPVVATFGEVYAQHAGDRLGLGAHATRPCSAGAGRAEVLRRFTVSWPA
ncbi:methyltransferase domain-containing protein [Nonomuraea fuscirosea]|uniref:methyltransferase domain-containing protein n=1 Tax=Nonomuraea fuscirosea TaxID=1291556 RepID=UPI0037B57F57